MVGSGTRVAMPAGVRKIPPPMVMPMTIPIELQSPRRRTRVGMAGSVYDDARRGHYNYQVTTDAGLVGSTILHYHILERLGGGGMGEVYLAEDQRLGRRVALKFLASHSDTDGEGRDRLVREAQAAAMLRSPHIAVTYDLVEHEGAVFIAMEYVEGELLSARIARGPLPVTDALDITLQVADALDEAHQRGII